MANDRCPECSMLIQARELGEQDFELCKYCRLPLLVLDPTGKAVKINDAFKSIWEVDPEKVLQNPGYNIFDDSEFRSQGLVNQLESVLEGHWVKFELQDYNFPAKFRIAGLRKMGLRKVSICAVPVVRDDQLRAIYLFYYDDFQNKDIKNLERQCQQLVAFADSFADLKHEINNPLLLIIGNAQLLLVKSGEIPEGIVNKLEKILGGAEKIREILEQHESALGTIYSGEISEMVEEL